MAEVILKSGAELADHIVAEAKARGVLVSHFLLPIYPVNPAARLNTIRRAKVPTRTTLDRVNRILTNKVSMPTVSARIEEGSDRRLEGIVAKKAMIAAISSGAVQISSAPCFHCGARAEVGCRHRKPTKPKVDTTLAFWPLEDADKDGRNVLVRNDDQFAIAKFTRIGWVYSGSHRPLDFAPTHAYDPARRQREASHG